MFFSPTSQLNARDIAWTRGFLAENSLFALYFECALEAWRTEGLDNRGFLIGRRRAGLIQMIRFERVSIYTSIGDLDADELARMLDHEGPAELHVEPEHARILGPLARGRLRGTRTLRYYELKNPGALELDPRCRLLAPRDFGRASAFYAAHYPQTIFSPWMLGLPFLGIFDRGELVATAGTVIVNRAISACNIGNFLTAPSHRGRGLARVLAQSLVAALQAEGFTTFTLATTEENSAAWRAYESIGFRRLESRPQLELGPCPVRSGTVSVPGVKIPGVETS